MTMKQIFILLMVAMCAIIFAACSDDDDTTVNPDGKRLVSKICKERTQEEDYYELNFQYDKNGNIEKIVERRREDSGSSFDDEWTDTYTFSRSGNKITSKNDYTDETGTETYTTVYTLNDKGYISQYEWTDEFNDERIIHNTLSYDNNGLLNKRTRKENEGISVSEYTYEYSWSNGNLISERQLGSNYVTNYTYTNEENKANIDLGAFWGEADYDGSNYDYLELFGYLGSTNKNCLYKYSGSYDTYTYKYSFDTNGYVTKMKKYDRNSELLCTYTIEYK